MALPVLVCTCHELHVRRHGIFLAHSYPAPTSRSVTQYQCRVSGHMCTSSSGIAQGSYTPILPGTGCVGRVGSSTTHAKFHNATTDKRARGNTQEILIHCILHCVHKTKYNTDFQRQDFTAITHIAIRLSKSIKERVLSTARSHKDSIFVMLRTIFYDSGIFPDRPFHCQHL